MLNCRRPENDRHDLYTFNCTLKLQSMVDKTSLNCQIVATLTESHLILAAPESATYRVENKGDRRFDNLIVPLRRSATGGGLQGCKLVQPWFGPNYWQGIMIPATESTIEPKYEFKIVLSFPNGGAFEFGKQFTEQVQKVLTAQDLGIQEVLPEYQP